MKPLYTKIAKMRNTNLSIIPLIGGDDPQRGKTPAVRWSKYTKCLPTSDDLSLWFEKRGFSAYGIVCGSVSGLVVLDLDDADVAADFAQKFPDLLKTLVVRSGVRGTPHIYWRVNFPVTSRKVRGGDLKAEGGYVVGPGSTIGGLTWDVVEDAPIRIVIEKELNTALAYLTEIQPPHTFEEPRTGQITLEGTSALYQSLVTRSGCRNKSLFKSACRIRDEGWSLTAALDALTDPHVHATPLDQQPENPASRFYEAVATIRSAYSRPARPAGEARLSRLPGSLREALLARQDGTAILRVIESLHFSGMRSGETFTEREALERLRPLGVGRHSLLRALPIFVPLQPPAKADNKSLNTISETQTTEQKKCSFVSMSEPDKSLLSSQESRKNPYRPSKRYNFPDVESLCQMFGVKPSGGDAIQAADVSSAKNYRQALERSFIQRKPGEHFVEGLAARLHLSKRTIQRYHQDIGISVEPTFEDQPITRQNFRDLLMPTSDYKRYEISVWGHFLEDETGKRYPPYREIAGKLLKKKHIVFYRKQRANRYWIGEQPASFSGQRSAISDQPKAHLSPEAKSHPAISRKPAKAGSIHSNTLPISGELKSLSVGLNPTPTTPKQMPFLSDDAQPRLNPQSKRESKRKYRQEMADSSVEGLAQSVQKVVHELAPSERTMSIANARRLVETYGTKAVAHTLNKLIWLAGKGKIQNPAGFMIVASRQQWRIDNNATGLGDPAPEFKGEPARKPRNRPQSKTDGVHKSERWLTNRIQFELGQGNLEQVEQWGTKLDELVKSRTLRWYRWRVHFARENENPQSVKFWQGFLNRKMGIDEF